MAAPSSAAVSPGSSPGSGADPAAGRRIRPRWALVTGVVVVVAAAVAFVLWFQPRWRMWCHGADKEEFRAKLLAEQDPAIFAVMDEVLRDAKQSDAVRLSLAAILLQKNRLNLVEDALRDARLDVRVVALQTLARQPYFRTQYLDDPAYRVRETLAEWLASPTARGRASAPGLASFVYPEAGLVPPGILAAVRAMLDPATEAKEPGARAAAAGSLAGWKDCGSARVLLARAATDPAPFARLRTLQAAVQVFETAGCGDAMPEADVKAAVQAAVDWPGDGDLNRAVRMGAASALGRHPAWAEGRVEVLRARLDDDRTHEAERGAVFDALIAIGDEATRTRLPAWLHHKTGAMRRQAATAFYADPPPSPTTAAQAESYVVGYFLEEPADGPYSYTVRAAYLRIRMWAGAWVGLPEPVRGQRAELPSVSEPLDALARRGEFQGVTRATLARDVWTWLAERRGLEPAAAAAAFDVRKAFWAKARAGDVQGAGALLAARPEGEADLWAYERAFVHARSASR